MKELNDNALLRVFEEESNSHVPDREYDEIYTEMVWYSSIVVFVCSSLYFILVGYKGARRGTALYQCNRRDVDQCTKRCWPGHPKQV